MSLARCVPTIVQGDTHTTVWGWGGLYISSCNALINYPTARTPWVGRYFELDGKQLILALWFTPVHIAHDLVTVRDPQRKAPSNDCEEVHS